MATLDDLIKKLPPETREIFQMVWETLSPDDRTVLQTLLGGLPPNAVLSRLLLRLSTQQLRMAFGQKQSIAILGPTNVGKSTLYNQFAQNKTDRAEVSPLPGTTRTNQEADAGVFSIVDTPGADAIGEVGEREQQVALDAAARADFLIILFDAIQGIKQTELDLFNQLVGLGKPYVVALNKIDMVRRDKDLIVQHAAESLNLTVDQIIPIAAKTGEGLPQILAAVVALEPGILAALGRGMPQYRWQLAWRSIVSSATVSAVIALTPIPIIDFAPLLITQSVMVLGIARVYNYRITLARARELVATFGLGFLGRTLFYELSKFGGVPGWILAAAVASSTTVVMGYAAAIWFERGEKLSTETLNKLTRQISAALMSSLKDLGKRKPGKKRLQDRITQALDESDMAVDRKILDQQVQDEHPETD